MRNFLTSRQIRYKQFSDYLQAKSKKIVLNLRHFYKINSKFDKMRSYQSKNAMVALDQRRQIDIVNTQVNLVEQCTR